MGKKKYEEIQDSRIKGKLELIESFASQKMSPVGFMNFVLGESFPSSEIELMGDAYYHILSDNNAFGEGVRTHLERITLPFDGNTDYYMQTLDSITGEKYFQNRYYGVLTLSFSLWKEDVNYQALHALRSFAEENIENAKFIFCDVPETVVKEMIDWRELNLHLISAPEINDKYANIREKLKRNGFEDESLVESIGNAISFFPETEYENALDTMISTICGEHKESILMSETKVFTEKRVGF